MTWVLGSVVNMRLARLEPIKPEAPVIKIVFTSFPSILALDIRYALQCILDILGGQDLLDSAFHIQTLSVSLTGTVIMIDPVYRELKVMQDSDRKAAGIEKELPVIIPFDDIADLAGEGITSIEDYLGIEKYPDDI